MRIVRNKRSLTSARAPTAAAIVTLSALQISLLAQSEPDPPPRVEPVLVTPTQGRPAFVAPGDYLRVVAQLPPGSGDPAIELVARRPRVHRHTLRGTVTRSDGSGSSAVAVLEVPPQTPEQTYDLMIHWTGGELLGRHAVAVRKIDRRVRLVHLSNMNVGEIGTPTFDERLIDEINLFGPTLIVATGDYLDATHPDPERGWRELSDFLARFNAPVLTACGDHDDVAWYSRTLAPNPVGAVRVGPYYGLAIYDLPTRPATQDAAQVAWVAEELGSGGHQLAFVVAHDECPNLLRWWARDGMLDRMVRAGRLGLWFSGGHRDWDGREYLTTVNAARRMLYLRTHQSSASARDGAQGVSHYRVIDLDGERAIQYGQRTETRVHASIPVGQLHHEWDGPNDGSRKRVELTAVNTLPFRLDRLTVRAVVRKHGGVQPWCCGARLKRVVELEDAWVCWLTFDLPDKSMLHAVVGTDTPPVDPSVNVHFVVPQRLALTTQASGDGVTYASAGAWFGAAQLQNVGDVTVEVTPLVRLDGSPIAYRVVEESGPMATAYRLRLAPRQVLTLQLDLSAIRVAPGRRELQVYLQGGASQVPACTPLDVSVTR